MSKAEEFRHYAEEALKWAAQSKTEKEKAALIELARTWNQAALQIEGALAPHQRDEPSAPASPR